ncbi:MAG: hypothetical protein JXR30_02450 [Alphaproteobacteria bacterium]|nr:hypothetical protein [Alphaproteobacteria bacterium]
MKKYNTFILWGTYGFFGFLWARYVFISLPKNLSFLSYAGVETLAIQDIFILAFVPLFFFAFLTSFIQKSLHDNDFKTLVFRLSRGHQVTLGNLETISKKLIELNKVDYATQFFSLLPTVYQDFYESLRKILRHIVLADVPSLDKRPESQDLWILCRQFISQASRDPGVLEDVRRTFKKSEGIAKEFANFKLRYDNFLKTLKIHDPDSLIFGFIQEGPLGQTQAVLGHIYTRAFEKPKSIADLQVERKAVSEDQEQNTPSLLQGLSIGKVEKK